ncbi:hypothetical protein ACWED2_13125 [Amycolatopsis sp. NPDC005003]
MKRWARRSGVLAAAVTAGVLGAGAQAQAELPPKNVGWLYTVGKSGAVFFDADLAGYPSEEKITVCDNKTDGRGIAATIRGVPSGGPYGASWTFTFDPSNDGKCVSTHENFFADGYAVTVHVNEYWGENTAADAWDTGVA